MSFRGRDDSSGGNPNKIEMGDNRRFGGMDSDKVDSDDRSTRFDSSRGRRPPFGRGRRSSPGRDKPFGDRPRDFGSYGRENDYMPPSGRDMIRDRSPLHSSDDRFSDRFKAKDRRDEPGRKDQGRFYDDLPRDRYMGMDSRSRHEGPGNFGSRFDAANDFKHRPLNFPPPKDYYDGFPKPNECEIIAMNKNQRDYAESVEARIKNLGILVDILFLKDEALLTQTVDEIARKGSLYAMVISPQNETHGSITVNILHGTPQEHRNMPLEDALKLVSRNFHEHIRSLKESMERERTERGPYMGVVPADREIQLLLRMLADGRWISLTEINSVIMYLSERRDKIQGVVGDERVRPRLPVPASDIKLDRPFKLKDDQDVAQKEQDLQNRIINLMNQGPSTANVSSASMNQGAMPNIDLTQIRSASQPRMSPGIRSNMSPISNMQSARPSLDENLPMQPKKEANVPVPDPTSTSFPPAVSNAPKSDSATTTPTYINFDNPSVQKALDNLIQSGPNILKSISLSNTNVSTASQNVSPAKSSSIDTGVGHQNENLGMNTQGGNVGSQRNLGARNIPDMGSSSSMPVRNPPPMDVGPPRNMGNMSMGNLPPQRGPANNSDMGMQPGGYGRGSMPSMRGMNTGSGNMGRGYVGGNMGDQGMGSRMSGGLSDLGRMGQQRGMGNLGPMHNQDMSHGPSLGMSQGSNFQSQNQFNKYQGPGQQGNFGPSFNSGNMGGMPRPNFGGPQGMGGGPRRY